MGRWCSVKCNCPNRRPVAGDVAGEYECGPEQGELVQFSPYGLFYMAEALEHALPSEASEFAVFKKIADPASYGREETLALSEDERELWRVEIEIVKGYLSGEDHMPWESKQTWEAYWVQHAKKPNWKKLYGGPAKILDAGLSLCSASIETGNPVEFFW